MIYNSLIPVSRILLRWRRKVRAVCSNENDTPLSKSSTTFQSKQPESESGAALHSDGWQDNCVPLKPLLYPHRQTATAAVGNANEASSPPPLIKVVDCPAKDRQGLSHEDETNSKVDRDVISSSQYDDTDNTANAETLLSDRCLVEKIFNGPQISQLEHTLNELGEKFH
ncbi:unnamed protein product [Somion occarium]|uniref:Uncharacterized protein n=1 Tax=Somion occarium TaxID=3059160 RepID=A0ABP1DR25_9APHY